MRDISELKEEKWPEGFVLFFFFCVCVRVYVCDIVYYLPEGFGECLVDTNEGNGCFVICLIFPDMKKQGPGAQVGCKTLLLLPGTNIRQLSALMVDSMLLPNQIEPASFTLYNTA